MIRYKRTPNKPEHINNILHPLVKKWFFSRFKEFSIPQLHGVMEIHSRNNLLVSAPTGATKTLTGFLSIINELIDSEEKGILEDKIYCVYISPLRALSYDIEHNLKTPLKEIEELKGDKLNVRVAVRTGDTSQYERQKMLKNPPHILITTPESLSLMLSSPKMRENLRAVQWCIIDEVHALAENKRGTHLSLTLEHLEYLCEHMTRIGLSATISPLEEVAKYLVGPDRPCKIVDVQFIKDIDLKVLSPVPDLIDTTFEDMHNAMYRQLHKMIQPNKTTLIFTNTRAATERVVHNLKERHPKDYAGNIGAHHGSLSKEHRFKIEQDLREGRLKCVVSSTSLELGIDIGSIDLVILLNSPKSVARALQRIGRSGHRLNEVAKGRIMALDRDDLVECAVLLKSAKEKKIDKIHIPKNALDILAQQIVGMAVIQKIQLEELFKIFKRSYCYADLKRKDFMEIIDYLSGKFASLEDRHIYAKIWYDEDTGEIGKKGRLGRVIYLTNIGTIPDEARVSVKIGNEVVGTIDEGFLERMRPGDIFVLGGNTYQFKYTRGMTAQVSASIDRPPTVPSWFSEMLPLSYDLAKDIGRFRRLTDEKFMMGKTKKDIMKFFDKFLYVDKNGAESIYKYLKEQYDYLEIPSDKKIVVEHYNDGKLHHYIFHALFGRRTTDALSRAVALAISRTLHKDVEIGINDNGFYIASEQGLDIKKIMKLIKSDKLELILNTAIDKSEVLKRRFRHCASRALMILRTYKGRTKNVGRQQMASFLLLSAVRRLNPNFCILKEAKREVLEDLMDIKNAKNVLNMIEEKKIKIVYKETTIPSPFAFNIVSQGYSDILRIEDKMEFLKRMHEMILVKIGKKLNRPIRDTGSLQELKNEMVKRNPPPKLSKEQRILIGKIAILDRVPAFGKAELRKLIQGEDIDPKIIQILEKHRKEIAKSWPKVLSRYIIEFLDNQFSYENMWQEQDKKKEFEKEMKKEKLKEDLIFAAKKTKLDPQIRYDLESILDGEKKKIRQSTIQWLNKFLKKAIPKSWSDDLVKHLKKVKKQLY